MAATWLTTGTYPAIRAALATDLTAAALPDAVLDLVVYTGAAELAIKGLDPAWATDILDATKNAALQLAAIYWCAALVAPALPRLLRENIQNGQYSYVADLIPVAELVALLRARALSLVDLVTSASADLIPTLFTLAAGSRARQPALPFTAIPEGSVILGLG